MSIKVLDKDEKVVNSLFKEIEDIITTNKTKVAYQINNILVETYFSIGKVIVENEQNGNIRAEYGKEVLKGLSTELTKYLDLYDLLYIKVNVKIHKLLASGRIVAEKLPKSCRID